MNVTEKTRHYPSKKKKKPAEVGEIKYLSDGVGEPSGGFWSSENKAYMDLLTIKSLYQSEDWVFTSTDAIAHPISTLPIKVYKKTYNGDQQVLKVDAGHKVNGILANPNDFQNQTEFLYGLAADYVLAGNSYAWLGNANGLYHIPAENMVYRWGDNNLPDGYYIISGYDDGLPQAENQVDLDEVAHTKRPNPSSSLYGLTPFAPAKRSILFNRYSQEYINNFYLKGATPQMILKMDKSAQDKSLNRLQASFEQSFTGRRNQRRTMVLPKGVDADVLETKIADQELIELVDQNADRILSVLKIPKHVVGRQTSGSLGSEEMKAALKYFWQTTITDTARALEQSLTRLFKKQLGPDHVIAFDFDEVPELQDDLDAKAETSNKMLAFMTINEVRETQWSLPPISGGDVIAGVTVDAPVEPEPEPVKQKKNSVDYDAVKQAIKDVDESIAGVEAEKFDERYTAGLGLMIKQNVEAVKLLEKTAKEKIKIGEDEYREMLSELYGELQDDYVAGYMGDLEGVSDLGFDQQVALYVTSSNEAALAAAKERTKNGRYALLENRGIESFDQISTTTLDRVMDEIIKGVSDRLSINEVRENINQYFEKNTVNRAGTVARTETLQALTVGQESVFDEARKSGIKFNKVWITSKDDRVRETHVKVDKVQVKDDETFTVGSDELKYPRDPAGSAKEVINCRCTVLMVPEDEDFDIDLIGNE